MARKKKNKAGKKPFVSNPFSSLKGFSVPAEEKAPPSPPVPNKEASAEPPTTFDEEMALLGVVPLPQDVGNEDDSSLVGQTDSPPPIQENPENLSEEELFLAEMIKLDVSFEDSFDEQDNSLSRPSARRMKLFKKGKIVPDATLDLHGLKKIEVAAKMNHFLQNARYHDWQTLLVITGKGLHSETGESVLRTETERYISLHGDEIAEWGRAPQRYGGAGALVLFLKKKRTD